ncbi:unnamed protein product [Fraxinus pennsylvanica]|uniref:Sec23/Sec24 helical domain-containing protein n=1 Tax=Fraxinus pennsylvanica TaxID=56036 RepID=A0AAD1ZTA7_9LAMI|nr:unnamed protein product [Fraxinus pennsylvanica]
MPFKVEGVLDTYFCFLLLLLIVPDIQDVYTPLENDVVELLPPTFRAIARKASKNLHINILHSYRKFCASASASGQLILPEALKLLPLYTLGLLKSCRLRADRRVDDRMIAIHNLDEKYVLQQYDNPLSKRLNGLIDEIRRQRCSYLRLKLCRKGDPSG